MGVITRTFANNLVERAGPVRPNSKPIIINGDMAVAQRATSVTSHNAVSYTTVDRFKTVCEVGTYTVIQESLTSGAAYLAGFKNALRLDTTTAEATAGSAGEQTTIEQRIEGHNLQAFRKGNASAQTYTLAFWVKSNKTGSNFQVNLRDSDNSRQIGGTYNISTTNTWEHKVINYAKDTTGAFGDDNGSSLTIEWFLDGGSNYSGGAVPTAWEANNNADRNVTNFDLAGSTDNDWAITGVQLEVGTYSATTIPPFQFEDFGDNLARCQRYFQNLADGTEKPFANGFFWEAQEFMAHASLKGTMRAEPTLEYVTASGYYAVLRNGAADALSALTISGSSSRSYIRYHLASGQGLASDTKNRPGQLMTQNASSKIGVTAEL
jgi:hypothetical protein